MLRLREVTGKGWERARIEQWAEEQAREALERSTRLARQHREDKERAGRKARGEAVGRERRAVRRWLGQDS